MKVTVDIDENDLDAIMRISGERKKGPAISKFLSSGLRLERRRQLSQKVLSGELGINFPHSEAIAEKDQQNPWDA